MIDLGPAGLAAAFAAGFVTFLSPCVLPIVPGYLAFVSGLGVAEQTVLRRSVVVRTAGFVAGFSAMFIALGAGAALFGDALLAQRRLLETVAGAFLVLAGLVFLGVRLPLAVARERRFHLRTQVGPLTPVVAGVAFAVGWTPCIGPTLAGILALSAADARPAQGAVLLGAFSLGLGVPFLISGLAVDRALGVTGAMRRHSRMVGRTAGALLVVFGLLLATGALARLTARLAGVGIEV